MREEGAESTEGEMGTPNAENDVSCAANAKMDANLQSIVHCAAVAL